MIRGSFGFLLASAGLLLGCPSEAKPPPPPPAAVAADGAPSFPAEATAPNSADGKFMALARSGKTLYATIETNKGKIVTTVDGKIAPYAAVNFVGLAMGEKEWSTPQGEKVKRPLYENTVFHRVIAGFMIQGGDPQGDGTGSPGFSIPDDFPFQRGLTFTKGVLAMARKGIPNSGGCQFFITVGAPTWLNGQYTIFGKVLTGQEVADAISVVPKQPGDRPVEPVIIQHVTISETNPAG